MVWLCLGGGGGQRRRGLVLLLVVDLQWCITDEIISYADLLVKGRKE